MNTLIELLFSNFKDKNYEIITRFGITLLIFFAPSFSYFFIYEINFFEKIDIIKLLIICLILNIIFFSLIYFYKYISIEIKLSQIDIFIEKYNLNQITNLNKNYIKDTLFKDTSSSVLSALFILYYPAFIRIIFPRFSLELSKEICISTFLICIIGSSFSNILKLNKNDLIYNKSNFLIYIFIFSTSFSLFIIKIYEKYMMIVK